MEMFQVIIALMVGGLALISVGLYMKALQGQADS